MNPTNPALVELSELLNRLPIIPANRRYPAFRNPVGISNMMRNFWDEVHGALSGFPVGNQFHVIDDEFKGDYTRLHNIAEAIRRNASALDQIPFGDPSEEDGFPEGAYSPICIASKKRNFRRGIPSIANARFAASGRGIFMSICRARRSFRCIY